MIARSIVSDDEDAIPPGIGKPATRALTRAGYTKLSHLTKVEEHEVGRLHGVGPKAIRILRESLSRNGKSFLQD